MLKFLVWFQGNFNNNAQMIYITEPTKLFSNLLRLRRRKHNHCLGGLIRIARTTTMLMVAIVLFGHSARAVDVGLNQGTGSNYGMSHIGWGTGSNYGMSHRTGHRQQLWYES